jgi:hypothetical protein
LEGSTKLGKITSAYIYCGKVLSTIESKSMSFGKQCRKKWNLDRFDIKRMILETSKIIESATFLQKDVS